MLIDTAHIDQLRVNFVSHFTSEGEAQREHDELMSIIDNYPKAMTTEVRQWAAESQPQKARLTAPLATVDTSKSTDDFEETVKQTEGNTTAYEQNESNGIELKVGRSSASERRVRSRAPVI